jgi:hypothetical protein
VHGQIQAFHLHRSMRRSKISGDDLDESGLAGPVVAHQSHDLARLERQRNFVEGMDGAEMLRNIFQFEKSHSGVTLRGAVAAMRVLFFIRRERALNYRACGQSMISAGINAAASQKDILHLVQRTKQSLVIFLGTYPLTHRASELSLSIADCGCRNWPLSSLRITFEDKLEIVRMLGT